MTINIPPFTNPLYGEKYNSEAITDLSITLTEGSSPQELVETFRTAMYALGYHADTIKQYIPTQEELDELTTIKEDE